MDINFKDICRSNKSKYIIIYNLSSVNKSEMKMNNISKFLPPNSSIKKQYNNENFTITFSNGNPIKILHISNSCIILLNYTLDETIEKIPFSILSCVHVSTPGNISIFDFNNPEEFLTISNFSLYDITNQLWKYNKPSLKSNTCQPIQKNIHFIWLLKDNKNYFQNKFLNNILTWYQKHSNFNLYLWSDCKLDIDHSKYEFIIFKDKNDIINTINLASKLLELKDFVELYNNVPNVCNRSNILRYCILYYYGGLYVDINDFLCLKSHEFLFDKYSFFMGTEPSYMYLDNNVLTSESYLWNNALIGSKKQHIIIKKLIEISYNNLKQNKIPIHIERKCSIDEANEFIYSITGGVIFRNLISGYLLDSLSDKKDFGMLPPYYFYPTVSYNLVDDNNIGSQYSNLEEKKYWENRETLSLHYNENTYIDKSSLLILEKNNY